jgi:hypothetical protein
MSLALVLTKSRPHSRKEAKLDTKTKLYQLNELAGEFLFLVLYQRRRLKDVEAII